jgi:hypothetical protein
MSNSKWSDLLDDGWPAATPPRDFADRVLLRVAAPPTPQLSIVRDASPRLGTSSAPFADELCGLRSPPPRAWRSSPIVFAAVAVAALVIFPLALHRHVTPARGATVAVGVAPDLGLERD